MSSQEVSLSLSQRAMENPFEYKWLVLAGCMMGYLFDAQDYMVIALALPLIVKDWGISLASAGLIATSSIFGAALGAFIWGPLADRYGRKSMLIACMAWFGILTVLCGFVRTYNELLILRLIAGLGLGGGYVLCGTLVSEFFPPEQRARASSAVQSSFSLGYGLAIAMQVLLVPDYGWRALFFSGALVFVGIIYIAIWVPESAAWLKSRENLEKGVASVSQSVTKASNFGDLFRGHNLRPTLLACLLAASCLVSYWGAGTWIPAFLTSEKGLNPKTMSGYLLALNAAGFIAYYAYGYIGDKLGRRWNFIIGGLASGVVCLLYMLASTPASVMIMGIIFGFITYGYWGPLAAFLSEQFPTNIRGTGLSLAFFVGRFGAAIAPFVLGGLATKYSLSIAIGLVSLVYAVGALVAYFMAETKHEVIVD